MTCVCFALCNFITVLTADRAVYKQPIFVHEGCKRISIVKEVFDFVSLKSQVLLNRWIVEPIIKDRYGYSEWFVYIDIRLALAAVAVTFAFFAVIWDWLYPFPQSYTVLLTCSISYPFDHSSDTSLKKSLSTNVVKQYFITTSLPSRESISATAWIKHGNFYQSFYSCAFEIAEQN
ncbi:unnamed protein product [Soboliphyme baturini]|uniref:Signal peptidase complex subunit 2 n=1 Tax=Soboliphyme baturini TaxID=241478 RepID=A0A3P8AMU8_9BILA|nr:unnamed protein product [Soboliphyme baturini]